jgi:thiol:disulfide interchange protein DsbD
VVLSPDEKLMNVPVAYTPDPKDYAQWLQCGLDAFHHFSPLTGL